MRPSARYRHPPLFYSRENNLGQADSQAVGHIWKRLRHPVHPGPHRHIATKSAQANYRVSVRGSAGSTPRRRPASPRSNKETRRRRSRRRRGRHLRASPTAESASAPGQSWRNTRSCTGWVISVSISPGRISYTRIPCAGQPCIAKSWADHAQARLGHAVFRRGSHWQIDSKSS